MTHSSVIVVDDDQDIRSNVKDILEDLGYRIDTAHDGPSALQLVKENSYDVALLDYKMPSMDGATLCSEIKKLRPEIVAIMITAYTENGGMERATAAGTWRILRKPVDIADLLRLVDQAAKEPVVLVVDDDADYCENLWQLLRDRGFRVRIAYSEQAAIAQTNAETLDVAIVDLRLGNGDGLNVIKKIRAAHPETKIILATGYPNELDTPLADVVLSKPIDVPRMLKEIG